MPPFEFATAARILFGPGTSQKVAPLVAELGHHTLVVTGRSPHRAAFLVSQLQEHGLTTTSFAVAGEPEINTVLSGVQVARQAGCDLVIAIGGGSALDTGKAIAILLTNGGDLFDYLEVIGRGQPFTQPAAPLIALPTTAGTGAEVTRNAVLASPPHRVKVSLRNPYMLPRLAVVDPELTYDLPPAVTASTGLDALTQLIEPFVSHAANPLTDALCREAIPRAARSLRRAYENGRDTVAREEMAFASLCGGLALANAKLGAVHGLAGPLGGFYPAPHGVICARLLPPVTAANVRALEEGRSGITGAGTPALARYHELGQLLTGNPAAGAADAVSWLQELCAALPVPPLRGFGLRPADYPTLITQSQRTSSMKGNPLALSDQELSEILDQAA
jgi:alcohol dehydrogenase class IV